MVSIAQIKELRESTGAGMMDCKKALLETDGNISEAADWLRKKGIAQAAKKGGRAAAEGLVGLKLFGTKASLIELNSETDFVAKNETFVSLAEEILEATNKQENATVDSLVLSGVSIQDKMTESIAVIGENLKLRRINILEQEAGFVEGYIHNKTNDYLGKIAVLVSVKCDSVSEAAKVLAKQIAMHIAAQKPLALSQSEVPSEAVAKEREIFAEQAKASGKPENIIEKMVEGRIRKFYQEVVLVDQAFVIDGKTPIKEVIAAFEKDNSCSFTIESFSRFEVGEGIEKKEDNFAEEAAAMANS